MTSRLFRSAAVVALATLILGTLPGCAVSPDKVTVPVAPAVTVAVKLTVDWAVAEVADVASVVVVALTTFCVSAALVLTA